MLWFVNQDGKTEGPLPEQRVAQLVRWGKISRRAYLCDEQLSSWVSIQRTAFAALLAPAALLATSAGAEAVHRLGFLRGGPWRLSTRAAQRLGASLAALSMFAGALQLASSLTTNGRSAHALVAPPHAARSAHHEAFTPRTPLGRAQPRAEAVTRSAGP